MSKISVKLYLSARPTRTGQHVISIFFTLNHKRYSYSTKESISKDKWGKDSRAKPQFNGSVEFNRRLGNMRDAVIQLLDSGTVTAENIDEKIVQVLGPLFRLKGKEAKTAPAFQVARPETFFEFITARINSAPFEAATIIKYKGTLRKLREFQAEIWKDRPLNWENIDREFQLAFVDFLEINQQLAVNSSGTHIKNIKAFMKEALKQKKHTNRDFEFFKVSSEESQSFALTTSEVETIYKLSFPDKPGVEFAKDLFVIACHTALRYSDLGQVRTEYIDKRNFLTITQQKTKAQIRIPLHRIVRTILEKYGNRLPPLTCNSNYNNHLKTIGKAAGLDEVFTKSITKGRKLIVKQFKKSEKLSSHTARRTAATNLYLSGAMPNLAIMALTGHKTEKDFLRYIKVSQSQHVEKIMQYFESQEDKLEDSTL